MRFFMIDRIDRWEVGAAAEAVKLVALSEDYFDDHFPRRPLMPAVLIVEGMAQLAGLLLEASLKERSGRDAKAVLTILEKATFREMVRPGDQLTYRAEILSFNESGGKAQVGAFLGERPVVSTRMVFAFRVVDDPTLDAKRSALLKLWMSQP